MSADFIYANWLISKTIPFKSSDQVLNTHQKQQFFLIFKLFFPIFFPTCQIQNRFTHTVPRV